MKKKSETQKTLAMQLGYFVGQYIVDRYLPTLSVDIIKTFNNISVTWAEGEEYRRLGNVYDSTKTKESWKEYREYSKKLELKYFPETLFCYLYFKLEIKASDVEEFKKGVICSLWNSDVCSYSIKPEDIILEERLIKLKLDV